ncbi:hypothetical protein [Aquimarina litoralis]|uniref:hypothetical protein n=1 Tax=Aquimarina litoralis TaxID=584605 RepID=UPI001C591106|nr:hypothetical protein [Aquimarina litoralis]MBW1297793.1 hypothetical protein [Aquimarina litoralis]
MKKLFFLLFLFNLFFSLSAQEKPKQIQTPKIITKLKLGKKINLKSKSLQFLKLVEDSRCPKYVSCVWEGQAKVIVGVYENDILVEEKLIIIGAKGITPDSPKELLKQEEKAILGYNLSPYPVNDEKIPHKDYYLELLVK